MARFQIVRRDQGSAPKRGLTLSEASTRLMTTVAQFIVALRAFFGSAHGLTEEMARDILRPFFHRSLVRTRILTFRGERRKVHDLEIQFRENTAWTGGDRERAVQAIHAKYGGEDSSMDPKILDLLYNVWTAKDGSKHELYVWKKDALVPYEMPFYLLNADHLPIVMDGPHKGEPIHEGKIIFREFIDPSMYLRLIREEKPIFDDSEGPMMYRQLSTDGGDQIFITVRLPTTRVERVGDHTYTVVDPASEPYISIVLSKHLGEVIALADHLGKQYIKAMEGVQKTAYQNLDKNLAHRNAISDGGNPIDVQPAAPALPAMTKEEASEVLASAPPKPAQRELSASEKFRQKYPDADKSAPRRAKPAATNPAAPQRGSNTKGGGDEKVATNLGDKLREAGIAGDAPPVDPRSAN